MDNNLLLASPAPHVRAKDTTTRIMLDVIIALTPALIAATVIFGWEALALTAICVVTCVVGEFVFEKICKRTVTVGDLSAVVTGMLLAFNLPAKIEIWWQAIIGSLVAIVVVKQLFGGIGRNFANPAITARIVMMVSFAEAMSPVVNDAVSSATPLSGGEMPSVVNLLIGNYGGALGETCALAILAGGIYLLARRVISWHTPVAFIGTAFIFAFALGENPVNHILTGGIMLGAIFMATDYSTTPTTKLGKIIFGVGCGLITVLIRVFGNYPEGVSFAILFMNILTPLINNLTRRKPFGGVKQK